MGLVTASIAALSLDVYQGRTPAIEVVLSGKTATKAPLRVTFVGANFMSPLGDLHGRVPPVTLQTGKKRQAYQGGVGRSPTICFSFLFLIIFLEK